MTETIKSAKEIARFYMRENIPCWVIGPPGVGKSEMWKQIAEEENLGWLDLRLPQMDPVDLRGLPTVKDVLMNGCAIPMSTWAMPDMWPIAERDGPRGILVLDELSDTGRAMQSAAYQVVLDHRAGPHQILDGWYIAAAGNRREDKAAAQAVSTALANRFGWIEVEADAEALYEYGTSKGWHAYVLGYLKWKPEHVSSMEGANGNAYASPRTWERVARGGICDSPPSIRFRLMRGLIGEGIANVFDGWIKTLDLPTIEEIIANPKGCHIPDAPGARYAVSSMISRHINSDNFDKIMIYITRQQYGRDFEILTTLEASRRDPSLCDHKSYIDFIDRNQDLQL